MTARLAVVFPTTFDMNRATSAYVAKDGGPTCVPRSHLIDCLILSLDCFVNEPVALTASGVKSRSTLRSMIKEGLFPKPIRVSPGRIAWSKAEIAAGQKDRIQERDDAINNRRQLP